MPDVAWRFLRTGSGMLARRKLDLTVEGAEHLPRRGPVIIAARHYHHLYDGVAMFATVRRPLHILVGLDWVRNPTGKAAMTALCRAAEWPVVMRRDGATPVDELQARRELRQALVDSLAVLEKGHALLVFPEGYPNIDPGYTPKPDEHAFLPFQPGFARLATLAAAQGMPVPIVPAGFVYERGERWRVTLRFGAPVTITRRQEEPAARAAVEAEVRRLSGARTGQRDARAG
jgi:putative membrane protein